MYYCLFVKKVFKNPEVRKRCGTINIASRKKYWAQSTVNRWRKDQFSVFSSIETLDSMIDAASFKVGIRHIFSNFAWALWVRLGFRILKDLINYEERFRWRALLEQQPHRLASAKMSAAKSTIGARAGKQTKFKTKDERHKMIETTDINRNLRNAFAYFVRIH